MKYAQQRDGGLWHWLESEARAFDERMDRLLNKPGPAVEIVRRLEAGMFWAGGSPVFEEEAYRSCFLCGAHNCVDLGPDEAAADTDLGDLLAGKMGDEFYEPRYIQHYEDCPIVDLLKLADAHQDDRSKRPLGVQGTTHRSP